MTKLTAEQQEFLDDLLTVRATKKGRLGGKQLSKIKDQYADFLRRGRKATEALKELEAYCGRDQGNSLRTMYDKICEQVDVAADAGDETVFARAYDEMEAIKTGARNALEGIKAEEKEIAAASEKFQLALAKVRQQGEATKQKAVAGQLAETCAQWLRKYPGAVAPAVGRVFEQAMALGGTPPVPEQALAQTLALAGALANETFALCRVVDEFVDDDDFIDPGKLKGYVTQMAALQKRLGTALQVAQTTGHLMAISQLERASAQLTRSQWRADPPALDDTTQGSSDDSEQDVQPNTKTALLTAPVETLTNAEKAERALLKVSGLVDHLVAEVKRVDGDQLTVVAAAKQLKLDQAALQAVFAADFRLIDDALADAKSELTGARDWLTSAQDEVKKAQERKDKPGAWENCLSLATIAIDSGMAQLAACEKAGGAAEGGIEYVKRSGQAIDNLPTRLKALDEVLLTAVQTNTTLLADCDKAFLDPDQRDLLKHLAFTASEADKSRATLGKIVDQKSFDKAVQTLMAAPKLGTAAVTMTLAQCHQLLIDTERFYGGRVPAKRALDKALHAKFDQVENIAKLDVARYTMPVVLRPSGTDGTSALQSVGVAIVGGGPIGLLTAVEARMSGASQVHVYEGRNDAYSRMNVLKIDEPPAQRFAAAGVSDAIFPQGYDKKDVTKHTASVRTIEIALEARCISLGIHMERDRYLLDVQRDAKGKVLLTFKGDPVAKSCDVLIVATGGSVASAQKYANNVVLSDVLGIPFQKSAVKDYAAVGLFDKNATRPATGGKTEGWSYDFETAEVNYLVTQLTEEEYDGFTANPRLLIERLQTVAKATKVSNPQAMKPAPTDPAHGVQNLGLDQVDAALIVARDRLLDDLGGIDNFYGSDKAQDDKVIAKCVDRAKEQLGKTVADQLKKAKGDKLSPAQVEAALLNFIGMEFGASRFPIEFQQARSFVGGKQAAVLVGDSGATPHPSASKGLNTGISEMGAVRDLVEDLQRGSGSEEDRALAMQMYEFELKRRTDALIVAGFESLQSETRNRVSRLYLSKGYQLFKPWWGAHQPMQDWVTRASFRLDALSVGKDKAADDRDWSRREAAVKALRAFVKKVEAAFVLSTQLISGGETDPVKMFKPFEDLIAVAH